MLTLGQSVADLPRIRLRGLMCLPANRNQFRCRISGNPLPTSANCFELIKKDGIDVDTLSMGMSGDYAAAI